MKKEFDFANPVRNPYAVAAPRLSAKWKREVRRRCAEVDRGAKLSACDVAFAKVLNSPQSFQDLTERDIQL
jgi:hypothetical protein